MSEKRYCKCGCKTVVKNEWARGHKGRKSPVDFVIEDKGYKSCCWVWKLKIHKSTGYGSIKREGKDHIVHKYYWEKINGKTPDGLVLDHLCNTRACMRPDHLEPKTQQENIQAGLQTPLTREDVLQIKRFYEEGKSQRQIGNIYGINQNSISRILKGKRWSNVGEKIKTISPIKLNESQVKEIKERRAKGETYESIRKNFNIGKTQMGRICRGESWSYV